MTAPRPDASVIDPLEGSVGPPRVTEAPRSLEVQLERRPGSTRGELQQNPRPELPRRAGVTLWRRREGVATAGDVISERRSKAEEVPAANRARASALLRSDTDAIRKVRPAAVLSQRAPVATKRLRSVREDLLILSRKRGLYSTRRLVEAARAQGRRVRVVDTLRCTVLIAPEGLRLLTDGRLLRDATIVLPRIGASVTRHGLAVLHQLELMNIPILNGPAALARSRDKLLATQVLAQAGLDVPRTAMAHAGADAEALVAAVGGLPAVVKLLRGTQGVGVMLASSMEEVRSYLATFRELGEDVVLQEFVAESAGRDVRALVVGDRVVAAMRRRAGRGEFRSNLHRGGTGEALTLSPEWEALAVRATRLLGLEVAGVDLLEGRDGPRVLELNSSPGLEGIEAATGRDLAGAVIAHALEVADRRGQATLAKGR